MRRTVACLSVLLALFAVGCGEPPLGPSAEVYTLASVNGQPLPQAYGDAGSVIEVTRGELALAPDGSLLESLTLRCRESLPTGTTCHVEGNGVLGREGTYSRSEGWIEFEGTRFPAMFGEAGVDVTYRMASGFPKVFEYR